MFSDLVLDHLISCNKLEECSRDKVRDTLLRRHRHQKPTGIRKGLSNIIGKSKTSSNNVQSNGTTNRKSSTMSLPTTQDNGLYATFPTGKKINSDKVLSYQVKHFDIMNKGTKKESNENISDQETQIINKLHIQMIRF